MQPSKQFVVHGTSGTTYTRGKYSVTVGPDSSIRVKHRDWLSKYSWAIYGNYWTVDVFARKDSMGSYVPIRSPNWIDTGEILYYIPTGPSPKKDGPIGGVPSPITDRERKQRVIEHFKLQHPEAREIVEKVADVVHSATDLAEVCETIGVFSDSVIDVTSPIGLVAFPIAAGLDILNSYKADERGYLLRGRAYGMTSWAFGDPLPPPPASLRGNSQASVQQALNANAGDREMQNRIREGARIAQANASIFQHAWTEGAESAIRDLDKMVQEKHVPKSDCQVILQALGDNDRNTLAIKIMTQMAKEVDDIERGGFWAPPPRYPSQ